MLKTLSIKIANGIGVYGMRGRMATRQEKTQVWDEDGTRIAHNMIYTKILDELEIGLPKGIYI